ncbi:MAG: peptidase S8, partial [Nitrosopumilus sp.]|nr:peptidase S8 [Nitrosopumilus sp.]
GSSIFSQGGGFFPVKNKDNTSTVLYVPINQTGTYTLLTHSTLFGGNSTTEPITLAAKFTNISSQDKQEIEFESNDSVSENDYDTASKTETLSDGSIPKNDSNFSFNFGITLGIIVGIAIGIIFIFINKQKLA